MIPLPKPIGPVAPVPDDAVPIGYDREHAVYYRIGILVWRLQGEQWSFYGYKDQWPEPLNKDLTESYHALNSVYR